MNLEWSTGTAETNLNNPETELHPKRRAALKSA
jgi:hypothetical protein